MLGKHTEYFRRIDVSIIESVRAHGTVESDRTDGRQTYYGMFQRNLQLFSFVVVDALRARGTVWYDRTDGLQSYINMRTSKISVQLSRAFMHQHYLKMAKEK
jgi:hypothetical protein